MPISFHSQGDFKITESFLRGMKAFNFQKQLEAGAQRGVRALAAATPADSGLAAHSWTYEITSSRSGARITWLNTDVESGFPVAIMLQYGYGTGTGGYVQGRDYINPAMKPIFDQIANDVWKAVISYG